LAAPRLLPLNSNCFFDAFKIAHGHVDVWIFLLEIMPGRDGKLLVMAIAARLAVDRVRTDRAECRSVFLL
jgi:hypothetical protein